MTPRKLEAKADDVLDRVRGLEKRVRGGGGGDDDDIKGVDDGGAVSGRGEDTSDSVVRRLSRKLSEEIRMRDLAHAFGAAEAAPTSPSAGQRPAQAELEEAEEEEENNEEEDDDEDGDADEEEPVCMLSFKDADAVVAGLRSRRAAKSEALGALGAPPSATQLLELFREFAMSYTAEVYSNGQALREVFDAGMSCSHLDSGSMASGNATAASSAREGAPALVDAVAALSSGLDDILTVENLMHECARVDGLAPYLMAPERCLRRVTRDGIALARAPVAEAVERAFSVLMDARNGALKRLEDKLTMRGVGVGTAGIAAASRDVINEVLVGLLSEWKDDSARAVLDAVRMEETLIDDSFFSKKLAQRRRELAARLSVATADAEDATAAAAAAAAAAMQESQEQIPTPKGGALSIRSIPHTAVASALSPRSGARADPKHYRMGYLDKMGGKRTWARRFFVLSERHGRLYIFRSAKEKTARAMIDLRLCEFVRDDGDPTMHTSEAALAAPAHGILVRSIAAASIAELGAETRSPRSTIIYKGRSSLRLRADSRAAQEQWLSCLEKARANAIEERKSRRDADDEEEDKKKAADAMEKDKTRANVSGSEDADDSDAIPVQRGDTVFSLDPRLLADPSRWISARCLAPDEELLRMAADDVRQYVLMAHAEIARSTPKLIVLQMIDRAGGDEILSSLIARAAALPPSAAAQALGEPVEKTLARTALQRDLERIEEAEREAEVTIKVSRRMKRTGARRGAKGSRATHVAAPSVPIPARIVELSADEAEKK